MQVQLNTSKSSYNPYFKGTIKISRTYKFVNKKCPIMICTDYETDKNLTECFFKKCLPELHNYRGDYYGEVKSDKMREYLNELLKIALNPYYITNQYWEVPSEELWKKSAKSRNIISISSIMPKLSISRSAKVEYYREPFCASPCHIISFDGIKIEHDFDKSLAE